MRLLSRLLAMCCFGIWNGVFAVQILRGTFTMNGEPAPIIQALVVGVFAAQAFYWIVIFDTKSGA